MKNRLLDEESLLNASEGDLAFRTTDPIMPPVASHDAPGNAVTSFIITALSRLLILSKN